MSKQYTRKIGQNRGKARLWLEGSILLDSGFKHGMAWDVVQNRNGSLKLLASNEGGRRVAGTPERPIIDINSEATLDGFGGHTVTIKVVGRGALLVVKNSGEPK